MNKPVILPEEARVAPVAVADIAAPGGAARTPAIAAGPAYAVLGGISLSHFLNDTMQSLIPSVYPILKANYALDFGQIGLITLAFQFTASLLQPLIGAVTDKKPMPYSLALGMGFTFFGLLLLSVAHNYPAILIAAALVGLGSAVFHPESSRIARTASGGRFGFAQAVFQVGGNLGTAMGPVLAALIVVPFGQPSIGWFSIMAFGTIVLLWRLGAWYKPQIANRKAVVAARHPDAPGSTRVLVALGILVMMVFSKSLYAASLSSYYTFYLMGKFGVSTQGAQFYLFLFLAATAAGTFCGGSLSDRFGRRYVIWFSILGALPFTLALPYAGLTASAILSILAGFIMASAVPAIMVFAQELMPHRFGMISGLFYGFSFGVGGLGAAMLGRMADRIGIDAVYQICSFLPAIGLLAIFLPKMSVIKKPA